MKKSAVVFDLDGVVLDSLDVMRDSFCYAFKQHFPDFTPPFEEYMLHLGKGFTTIMKELNLPLSLYEPFKKKSIALSKKIKVFAGIMPLLEFLKEGNIYIGLSTGKDKERTHKLLKQNRIMHYFSKIICIDDVERGKPAPESLTKHFDNENLEKDKFFFIGDSTSDILCAHNARVHSIAALWGMGSENRLKAMAPTFTARSPFELKEILGQVLLK